MLTRNLKTSACIVGAGPVGMSMALLLKKFGIDSVILERSPDIAPHPKAHVICARSMEIMKELGVEPDVTKGVEPIEQWTNFRYCRHVLDPDPYGIINHFKNGIKEEMAQISTYSMSQPVHYSQNRFCSLLKDKLMAEDMKFTDVNSREKHFPILFSHKFLSYDFNEDEYKLKVQAVDLNNMQVKSIDCKYLIGCDGVWSKIRESIGGEFLGRPNIANFINIHFKSRQLADEIKRRNCHAMLYFIYNANVATILVNHSLKHAEFVLQTPYFPPIQSLSDLTEKDKRMMILNAINGDGLEHRSPFSMAEPHYEISEIDEISSVGTWQMSACYSDTFADPQRKIFIAGDSGHSIPPAGGYGMNSGIADAHNLAHKIADAEYNNNHEVLNDYDPERRFMNEMIAKFAHKNFRKGEKVVSKLNVDMKSFTSLTRNLDYYIPKIVPAALTKAAFNTTIKIAQRFSLNQYYIKQKREYLKNYDNGIALLFPNLDFSYWYPQTNDEKREVEQFLKENYDSRDYKLVNRVGSLLPLFTFWCPYTKQSYASREYIYLYQKEEKRPFYFLFKFGGVDDSVDNIEWTHGDKAHLDDIIKNKKMYLHIANIRYKFDPETENQSKTKAAIQTPYDKAKIHSEHAQEIFDIQDKLLGLSEKRSGRVLVRPDGHIIGKGYSTG